MAAGNTLIEFERNLMTDLKAPRSLENDQRVDPRPLITIVVPARDEEANIARLESELLAAVDPLPYRYEFLVVDNSSTDRTGELVKAICRRDRRWAYLRFSRDLTVEMSITAGYHYAQGDAIIVLYSDLQDPPDVIPRFIEKWREGYDVVYEIRTVRPDVRRGQTPPALRRSGSLQPRSP